MGKNMTTGIEWTDETWNPVTGCSKVSAGCDNCYAIRQGARLQHLEAYAGTIADGDWTGRINLVEDRFEQPLRWRKPRRILVNSMSDLFHPDVPTEYIDTVFATMGRADWHQFQVLTKRPKRMATELEGFYDYACWPETGCQIGPEPLPNVWLGTSIENDSYTFRANHLRDTPAAIRFLSLEPLLGPLPSLDLTGIDWVIVGGESGPNARPMHPDWVQDIRDRCQAARVPFFFKQWGEYYPLLDWLAEGFGAPVHYGLLEDGTEMARVGRHYAGRLLDGRTWDEYPQRTQQ